MNEIRPKICEIEIKGAPEDDIKEETLDPDYGDSSNAINKPKLNNSVFGQVFHNQNNAFHAKPKGKQDEKFELEIDPGFVLQNKRIKAKATNKQTNAILKRPSVEQKTNLQVEDIEKFYCFHCEEVMNREKAKQHREVHTNTTDFIFINLIDENSLKNHNITVSKPGFLCSVCNTTEASESGTKKHIISHMKSLACTYAKCPYECKELQQLGIHILKQHLYTEHNCESCCFKTVFESYFELRDHLKNDCQVLKVHPCAQCAEHFKSIQDLEKHREVCIKQEKLLNTRVKNIDSDDDFNLESCAVEIKKELNLNLNSIKIVEELMFQCMTCKKYFKTKQRLAIHKLQHMDGRNKQIKHAEMVHDFITWYTCIYCRQIFCENSKLLEHNAIFHQDIKVKPEFNPNETETGSYKCGLCDLYFSEAVSTKIHQITDHILVFSCKVENCGQQYESLKGFAQHVGDEHLQLGRTCKYCNDKTAMFATFAELKSHLKSDCTARQYCCDHCDKKFLRRKDIVEHLRSLKKNVSNDLYLCQHCSKTFKRKHHLKSHMRTHTRGFTFVCNFCGKAFTSAKTRKIHMDRHSAVMKYVCSSCGATFQTRDAMRYHEKKYHENTKSSITDQNFKNRIGTFDCEVCNASFRTSAVRIEHMEMHIEGKTFQCIQCEKFFQTRNSRRKHVATIHAPKKQKPEEAVICEVCGKSFRTKPIKQLHLDIHIDGKTFPCKMCDEMFQTRDIRKQHMRRTHRKEFLLTGP